MWTIRRVETVLSINQYDAENGKELLGNCCVAGSTLPLFKFPKRLYPSPPSPRSYEHVNGVKPAESPDFLDMVILAQWEDRAARGLFRYDVTSCETKVLPGEYGFVAQLNEGRHLKKRPTEFRVDQVLQPFDPSKFNFTKAAKEELLFCFECCESLQHGVFFTEGVVGNGTNAVIINVSPIEYGHVLLVPRIVDRIPQQIDTSSLKLALDMAVEAHNPFFRLGYNSLGAFATINHLHFQAYYLAVPFPVERAPTSVLVSRKKNKGVRISELAEYPVKGLVFESAENLQELAVAVAKCCGILQEKNIPFNLLIADCGSLVYLFPQCYAEKQARGEVSMEFLETQVNPAVWEISGHIVLKRKEDYERASEDYAWRLLAEVSLDTDKFHGLKNMCLSEFMLGGVDSSTDAGAEDDMMYPQEGDMMYHGMAAATGNTGPENRSLGVQI